VDRDLDPGGPKTRGSGGSGSATLVISKLFAFASFLNFKSVLRIREKAKKKLLCLCAEGFFRRTPPPTLSISVGVLYQMDRGPSISGIERRLQYIRICFIFCSKLHPGYCQGKREDACYAATGVFNLHVRIRFEFWMLHGCWAVPVKSLIDYTWIQKQLSSLIILFTGKKQCCGSGCGIRDPVPFWPLDLGSGMGKKYDNS
jgi:hypothetical protein